MTREWLSRLFKAGMSRHAKLHTPRPGFTGGAGEPPSTPTDTLLAESPRWEAACRSPLIGDVADRLRPPEALLTWVPQHNELAHAFSGLANVALGSAPAEHVHFLEAMAVRLSEDVQFAAEWAARLGGSDQAATTPATEAILQLVRRVRESQPYCIQLVVLWQWFTTNHLAWTREVMLRRPASDLRRRFDSEFDWQVVHSFRREINHALRAAQGHEWVEAQKVFDRLTGLLADWQSQRPAHAGPAQRPGPLQPGEEALRVAGAGIAAMGRLLSTEWDFDRPLREQVPDLPEGITAAPEDRYVMVLLGEAFYRLDRAEEDDEPPLDELLVAIGSAVEATAGPPTHHPQWGDASLEGAPFAEGTEAWVWAASSARIVLTSFDYDHKLPALVQAFVVPL